MPLRLFDNFRHIGDWLIEIPFNLSNIVLISIVRLQIFRWFVMPIVASHQCMLMGLLSKRYIPSTMWRNIKSLQIVVIHNSISNSSCILPPIILKTLSPKIFLKPSIGQIPRRCRHLFKMFLQFGSIACKHRLPFFLWLYHVCLLGLFFVAGRSLSLDADWLEQRLWFGGWLGRRVAVG